MEKSKVYFIKEIKPENLITIYNKLNQELKGKVAIKISTGEPGGKNYLKPELIKNIVNKLNGTIVECNTAYPGKRNTSEAHWQTIKDHGFLNIAPCDIMDEEGELIIPVTNGIHLQGKNIVGSHVQNYDSMLILSHFKGHEMGGFGGALKNMSIGIASSKGKCWIHTVGRTTDLSKMWGMVEDQDGFLESMAEACESVVSFYGKENMAYINIANNISIDCDCSDNPAPPEMKDIGIFASLDPVALDQCCYDAIINSSDNGKHSLIKRMKDKNASLLITTSEKLNIGQTNYELIKID